MDMAADLERRVGKTVDFPGQKAPFGQAAVDGPAASGAEIESQVS